MTKFCLCNCKLFQVVHFLGVMIKIDHIVLDEVFVVIENVNDECIVEWEIFRINCNSKAI